MYIDSFNLDIPLDMYNCSGIVTRRNAHFTCEDITKISSFMVANRSRGDAIQCKIVVSIDFWIILTILFFGIILVDVIKIGERTIYPHGRIFNPSIRQDLKITISSSHPFRRIKVIEKFVNLSTSTITNTFVHNRTIRRVNFHLPTSESRFEITRITVKLKKRLLSYFYMYHLGKWLWFKFYLYCVNTTRFVFRWCYVLS